MRPTTEPEVLSAIEDLLAGEFQDPQPLLRLIGLGIVHEMAFHSTETEDGRANNISFFLRLPTTRDERDA